MIKLSRILHPTDLSECSSQALEYATALAGQFGAELHLLHVIPDPVVTVAPPIAGFMPKGYQEEIRKHFEQELNKLVEDQNLTARTGVVEGTPFVEIIRYAREQEIDLVVMGTHGRSGLVTLLIGSVAENVVRKSHCPVLTVHPEKHEYVSP